MKIVNLGSLNIDKTYLVGHIVKPKETTAAVKSYSCCGGKGLNQSVALAKAGAEVYHAGLVGEDGGALIRTLEEAGVKTDFIRKMKGDSGHAIIQLDQKGENAIIIDSGANGEVDREYIDGVLENFGSGDLLLLQNEISNVDYAIRAARKKNMTIAFNLSPVDEACFQYPLEAVDYFIVNEVEAGALAGLGEEAIEDVQKLIASVTQRYPDSRFVITLGEQGAYFADRGENCFQEVFRVNPIDTTGAGDTFCGYFLAQIAGGRSVEEALLYSSAASAIAIGREGASASIPDMSEVKEFIKVRRNL